MKTVLVAFATLAFATSAYAAPTNDNPFAQDKAILNLKGLDLSSAEGQQRLAIRMDQAARAVCGDRVAALHLALESKAQECRSAVVADIRAQIETRTANAASSSPVQLAALR